MNGNGGEVAHLTTLPFGLLEFLGIKNRGHYPSQLAGVLAPIIELRDLYEVSQLEDLNAQITSDGSLGSYIAHTVPQAEIWHVHACSARSDAMGAGDVETGVIEINPAGLVARSIVGDGRGAVATGETMYAFVDRDFWAKPGDQIRYRPVVHTGTCTVDVSVRLVRYGV